MNRPKVSVYLFAFLPDVFPCNCSTGLFVFFPFEKEREREGERGRERIILYYNKEKEYKR